MDIGQVNSVLLQAIIGFQEADIDGISEAAYTPPTPAALAKRGKKGKERKRPTGPIKSEPDCMRKYRDKQGKDFNSFSDCVDAFRRCSKAKEPEGVCVSIMKNRTKKKG